MRLPHDPESPPEFDKEVVQGFRFKGPGGQYKSVSEDEGEG